jgi:chromosome segregation ATPase
MSDVNEVRKSDLKNRISALREELKPLLTNVKSLRERISYLEADLAEVLDEKFSKT